MSNAQTIDRCILDNRFPDALHTHHFELDDNLVFVSYFIASYNLEGRLKALLTNHPDQMQTVRSCGCKGIRSCLTCENKYDISKPDVMSRLQAKPSYVYCPLCNKLIPGWDINEYKRHPHHDISAIDYPGVYIKLDFLNTDETKSLMQELDRLPWQPSQSGRRKQNFGPKCNFKSRKIRLAAFDGFPKTTRFVQEKFKEIPLLHNFRAVEQCTLEYDSDRGSSIDPHIDDCWIWGERVVTVNVLGDSVLTMTIYHGPTERYNLDCVSQYTSIVERIIGDNSETEDSHNKTEEDVSNNTETKDIYDRTETNDNNRDIVVRLPMPAGSLIILYGPARYKWEHSILREDITGRRVCLTYRELTPPYLEKGEHYEVTAEILRQASHFWTC